MLFRKKTESNSGFTLTEMIMVICMIAIISAIATPNIVSSLPDYQLRSATRDIVSCLQQAKLRAVKEGATTAMIFDIANDKYTAWVDNGSGGGAGNLLPDTILGEVIFKQINLPNDITFYQNTTFNINTFGFNSRGFPSTNVGTIFIKNNQSHYRKIIINSPGNIRVQKSPDGATWN